MCEHDKPINFVEAGINFVGAGAKMAAPSGRGLYVNQVVDAATDSPEALPLLERVRVLERVFDTLSQRERDHAENLDGRLIRVENAIGLATHPPAPQLFVK